LGLDADQQPATVPLEQLWNQLPQPVRQDLIVRLTRMVAQRLAPQNEQEQADE